LSDHFGVEAQFAFTSFSEDTSKSPDHADEVLIPARPHSREAVALALAAITIYASHSHTAHKSQLMLFGASLIGIPVLSVAGSFQPLKWLNWIFILLGIGNGVVGATMLYTGFVGGRWERSAIKNVMGDMAIELERSDREAADK
jgi:sphingomyelin phosphodiesterase 2